MFMEVDFHLLRRAMSFFKRYGLRASVFRGFTALYRLSFLGRMILFHCFLPVQNCEQPQGFQIERVGRTTLSSADHLRLVNNALNPAVRARQIAERFEAGGELWLAKLGEELVGYGWTIRGRTMEPHFFPIQADDLHLFDFFVFPEFRGRGLNVALLMDILVRLSGEGIRWAHIECAAWNKAQIHSLTKTPFCMYAEATKMCVLGRPAVLWLTRVTHKVLQRPR